MSPNDISTSGVPHRRGMAPRPKEMKPLLTNEPLPHDRGKKPPARPPKKRKPVVPTKPALSFDPKCNVVPTGRQDPPASPSVYSGTSTSESSASSYDEQQIPTFGDREIHGQFYNGFDAQKRSRISSSPEYSTSFCPDTPCTEVIDISSGLPDFSDSPVSYTSSSSPAPSDQSACPAEISYPVEYTRPVQPGYAYSSQGYIHHPDPYSYSMAPCPDRPPQGYPMQYSDTAYARLVPHGMPAYPDSNGYPYPPRRT